MIHYLYKISPEGDGEILGKFQSLLAAEISAKLLLVEDISFILSDDLTKIYFYENGAWDYDIMTKEGQTEFLEMYPNPHEKENEE